MDKDIDTYGNRGYYDLGGEFYADPHAPYHWVDGFEDDRGSYGVCYQDSEEYVFGPFKTEEEATEFVALLNKNYHNRECEPDSRGFSCRICGDITAKGMEAEERAMRELHYAEDYSQG